MELGWQKHFEVIVERACEAFKNAEEQLTEATHGDKGIDLAAAVYDALREGAAASFFLHHFADIVAAERASFVPQEIVSKGVHDVGSVRRWLAKFSDRPQDIDLLGDIADALKHSHLTRRLEDRDVKLRGQVLAVTADGHRKYQSESKNNGAYEIVVLAKSGPRTLAGVLDNVLGAWQAAIRSPAFEAEFMSMLEEAPAPIAARPDAKPAGRRTRRLGRTRADSESN
jgi:hypothetical protein